MLLRFCEWLFGLLYPKYAAALAMARDHDPSDDDRVGLHAAMRRIGWPGTPKLEEFRQDQVGRQVFVVRARIARWRVWRCHFFFWMLAKTKNPRWNRRSNQAHTDARRDFGLT